MKSVFRPVLSGVCLLSASTYSFAEDITFDDMTVTATRSERSALEVPASISSKSGDEVKADKASTQRELLNSIAGVRISQTGSTIGHMTAIRLPTGTKAYYLFLQDGIPLQSSGFFNHNGLAYSNFTSAGSVEVLKGAGTALYGSDAVGGTVNVISNDPMKNLGVKGTVEFGDRNFQRYGITGGTEIDKDSAVSVQASHTESDGWRNNSDYDRQELSVNYVNDLNDDNTVKLAFNANKFESGMTSGIKDFRSYRDDPDYVGDNVERILALPEGIDPTRKFDFARLSAEWQHQLDDMTALSTIVYLRSNRNRYSATWEGNVSSNDNEEKTVGLLFKAAMDFGRFRVISGVDAEYTEGTRKVTQDFDTTVRGKFIPQGDIFDYDVDYKALAPYTRVEIDLTGQLTLGFGGRYDINQFDYTNNTSNGIYGGTYFRPDSSVDNTYNHFSPKADLTYRIDTNQIVYARYANGFRVPQVSTLYSLKDDERAQSFDEEVTDTFEIGYKARLNQHQFETAVYHLIIDDTIVSQNNGEFSVNVNAGRTLHTGIEVSLASHWTEEWATRVAYSFSEHEFDDSDSFGDNEQARAPENLGNARLIYTPKAVPGLLALIEWEHVGSSWMDDENTMRDPGYDLANVKVNYELNQHLTLFGRVNNLTNRLYAESATLGRYGADYTPGAPREAFIGFEYKL